MDVTDLLQQQTKVQPTDRMETTSMKLVRTTYRTLHSDTADLTFTLTLLGFKPLVNDL